MAPVEIAPASGWDGGATESIALPTGVGVLDAGVPWPRTPQELDREWGRVVELVAEMTSGPARRASELSPGERYVMGVRAAARWTLGDSSRTPTSGRELEMSGAQIRAELALAERVVDRRAAGWAYASGVLEWLLWVTGAREELPPYPPR